MHIEEVDKSDSSVFMPLGIEQSLCRKNAYIDKPRKSVVINTQSGYVLLVLPSNYRINYNLLSKVVSEESNKLNDLPQVQKIFPDYVTGANISASKISDLPVYICIVDKSSEQMESVCTAGNFLDVMTAIYKH